MAHSPGGSIPFACQDWANTKAAYRFLDNDKVSEDQILSGHFYATAQRVAAVRGPILVMHDTTQMSYHREGEEPIGMLHKLAQFIQCGVLMHSSLVVTVDGLSLGLSSVRFWTRQTFKGTTELKRHVNPTRIPIEQKESYRWLENCRQTNEQLNCPDRCVHIGDRESDIYELFCLARELGTHFVVRTCVNRLAGEKKHTVADYMNQSSVKGVHRVPVLDRHGRAQQAHVELRYQSLELHPPICKAKLYPSLKLTVIHAVESAESAAQAVSQGRSPIDWKLLTDLPVTNNNDAIEKLNWYALRWRIETFHKVLKSGCKVEQSKLRTAQRLTNFIAIQCILAWRIYWITMLQRTDHKSVEKFGLTKVETDALDLLNRKYLKTNSAKQTNGYLLQLAKLGGYLARAKDPPPGITVIWRGLSKLHDIRIGIKLTKINVGN
jgi:hypothetical protein